MIAAAVFLTVLVVIVVALPASFVTRFLPPRVALTDLSGSVWHGSAGRIAFDGRDAGAVEWRLHPLALFALAVDANVHWVKASFVVDAAVRADRHAIVLRDVRGAGSIEDLWDLGLAPGWQGAAELHFDELRSDYARIGAAAGDLKVTRIASPQVANGVNLGSYELVLPRESIDSAGNIEARLSDTGGPLEVQARIQYSPAERTGLLSGTLRERPGAPPELQAQIANLAQLKPRDSQGRIPADLEFRF